MKRGVHPVMMVEKPENASGTSKRLLIYISGSRKLFFQLIIITVIITALTLYAPSLQRSAIDALIISGENQKVDFAQLGVMTALLIGVYIMLSVFTYLQGIFSARLSQTTVKNLRNDLFNKLVRLPVKYIDTHSHGDLMSRMTNNVENISNSVSQSLNSLISGVVIILGSLVIMLFYSPVLTLLCLSTIIITIFTSGFLSKRMRKFFKEQQHFLGSLNGHIEEMITGFHTVTAFNIQQTSGENLIISAVH